MLKRILAQYVQKASDLDAYQEIERLYAQVEEEDDEDYDDARENTRKQNNASIEAEIRDLSVTVKDVQHELEHKKAISAANLDSQINGLKESLQTIPPHLSNLSLIPQLMAVNRLEKSVESATNASEKLMAQEIDLQKSFGREKRLYSELQSLQTLLDIRLRELQAVSQHGDPQPELILMKLQSRIDTLEQRIETLESHVEDVLSGLAAPIIVRTSENVPETGPLDLHNVTPQLIRLIRALLKGLVDPVNSGGYIQISEPYNPLIKFLVNGDLITIKPNDPSRIKLRNFGT